MSVSGETSSGRKEGIPKHPLLEQDKENEVILFFVCGVFLFCFVGDFLFCFVFHKLN